MNKIIKKVKAVFGIIAVYKSWPLVILASIGLMKEGRRRICRLRNGLSFYVENIGDIHVLKEVFSYNHYGRFLSRIRDNSVVIDIGAHIGVCSILAAQQGKNVKVFSYEPWPQNFMMLRENIALNNLQGKVFPMQMAVGENEAPRDFYFFTERVGSSLVLIPGQKATQKVTVQCTTLNNIFKTKNIERCNFMKIDCEGAEHEILYNTSDDCFVRIESITLETHDQIVGNSMELMDFLKKHNFSVEFAKPPANLLFAEN